MAMPAMRPSVAFNITSLLSALRLSRADVPYIEGGEGLAPELIFTKSGDVGFVN